MVQKHSATIPKPPVAPIGTVSAETDKMTSQQSAELRALFISMAVEMSWQLAVVVIVPVVGGYMLDSHLHTTPWLTFIGLAFALVGVVAVLRRVLSESSRRAGDTTPKGDA